MKFSFKWHYVPISIGLCLLGVLYYNYDPNEHSFFPSCPFHSWTGLLCPGCGSQRAIHQLLHFDVIEAFRYNLLVPIAVPYLGGLLWFQKRYEAPYRTLFYSRKSMMMIFYIITTYWIVRNFLAHPHDFF